ncbi:MAG: DUF309 domain-containing protein [Planctomycetota bacterium]
MAATVRYSSRPLPAYAHTPGNTRRPTDESAATGVAPLSYDGWQASETHRYAVDLFNAGFWWEAHEAWEALWIAAGRRGPEADCLKAFIKLAAAGVKQREGRDAVVRRHAARCLDLLEPFAEQRKYGISLDAVRGFARHAATLGHTPEVMRLTLAD